VGLLIFINEVVRCDGYTPNKSPEPSLAKIQSSRLTMKCYWLNAFICMLVMVNVNYYVGEINDSVLRDSFMLSSFPSKVEHTKLDCD